MDSQSPLPVLLMMYILFDTLIVRSKLCDTVHSVVEGNENVAAR